jgi:signal transduction histidine kinase
LEGEEIKRLTALLDERTMKLMEREGELADQFEELEAQKEELTAAVEELINKNKELTDRNQELDQVLYRASHDLRSPVSSMFGVLNLLKAEEVPAHIQQYCIHFERMMHQMNGVVNTLDLLAQSTLDEIRINSLQVDRLIEEEIGSLSYLSNFRFIEFRKSMEGAERIQSDELLLRILVRSLLSNAIIFRKPQNGIVEIHVAVQGDEMKIEVKDDGEGISEEVAPKIFEMFYRGSEKSIGQGMGLYLVKKIVWRLRGRLNWQRANGVTVFTISIPVTLAPVS